MKRVMKTGRVLCVSVLVGGLGAGGCGSTTTTGGGTGGAAESGGSAEGAESGPISATGCSGATPVELTVLNVASWCTISIAGRPASTDATIKMCVADGTVDLSAMPSGSAFVIGTAPWMGTATDNIDGGTASATLMTKGPSTCVAVCCPIANGGGGCPATNPCRS
jgi:hypothetical protein